MGASLRLRVGMSRLSLLARPSPGALVLRIVWPLAVLFAATLTVVFGTIYGSAGEDALDELGPVLLSGVAATMIFLAVLAVALRWILRDLAASQERAQLLAGRDPLSSLPNRLLVTERLDMEIGRLGRQEGLSGENPSFSPISIVGGKIRMSQRVASRPRPVDARGFGSPLDRTP